MKCDHDVQLCTCRIYGCTVHRQGTEDVVDGEMVSAFLKVELGNLKATMKMTCADL